MEFDVVDSFESVLERPTQQRPEHIVEEPPTERLDFSTLEFEDVPDTVPQEEPEEEYTLQDAETNAELLVGVISAVNVITMSPLANWLVKKKRGGKPAISRMQIIAAKHFNGAELTEAEQRQLEQYQAYLADKKQLESIIPYTEDEMKALKAAAIPYCQQMKMKVNGGMAFWVQLGTMQLGRIMQILTI